MTGVLISIILPCYNQAEYLPEALESVLKQSHSRWECIIVDDGSPDETKRIADEWLIKDSRFSYIKIKNRGLSNARNVGINKAKGEIILPLDADDKIADNYIELSLEEFRKDETVKLVYCKAQKFGIEQGIWVLPNFSLNKLAQINMIFCASFFYKKDWLDIGGYDINMVYGLEDWEFWISLLKNGGTVKKIDSIGFYYRVKKVSMITNLQKEQKEEMLQYMSVKHADFFVKQLGSFYALNKELRTLKRAYMKKVNNKKYVLNLFLKTFFGISIFNIRK
ncbi:glycosyltransferase family 2 protein [Aequorivita lipolytica]|uniref:Glycosyltransferase n=1 Tax=Aequorivita lipolytica TaxID=153267 RepID=A0A5C6YP44_9FLAO|nr:glycosyltransferase [Aequorivita lipolytica]TXD68794.1 glycosyltransferase [Aequorivita lipolytica]SRX52043.1 putative glycosyltransferase EpsJ [Aequorivita lipolytica]